MYNIQLNGDDIEIILKSLTVAEEDGVINYDTVGRLWDYITGEVENQRAARAEENNKGESEE